MQVSRAHAALPTVHYLLEEVVEPSPQDEDISAGPALLHFPREEREAVVMPLEGQQAGHASVTEGRVLGLEVGGLQEDIEGFLVVTQLIEALALRRHHHQLCSELQLY